MPAIQADGSAATSATQPAASIDTPIELSAAEQEALALQYAPILYFHPDEDNLLLDPDTFIEQSTLRQERDFWSDKEIFGLGDVPPEYLAGIDSGNQTADGQLFLDHQNEALGDEVRAGDLENSPMLYQYDAQTRTITYHLFYAYNDGPPDFLGDLQNHEGDWERITVQLDENLQPEEVRYSAHDGMDVARSWAEAPKEDGRPVSYVGLGSHANLPEPGNWSTQFPGVNDVAAAGGRRYDLASAQPRDVTAQPWYGGYVMWGERGSLQELGEGATSGPFGPSQDKGPIIDADPERQPEG